MHTMERSTRTSSSSTPHWFWVDDLARTKLREVWSTDGDKRPTHHLPTLSPMSSEVTDAKLARAGSADMTQGTCAGLLRETREREKKEAPSLTECFDHVPLAGLWRWPCDSTQPTAEVFFPLLDGFYRDLDRDTTWTGGRRTWICSYE